MKIVALLLLLVSLARFSEGQANVPDVYDVLPYSAILQSGPLAGTVASVTSYNGTPCSLTGGTCVLTSNHFKAQNGIFGLASSLNGSIATALSVIPLASPASGVITKTDPVTGAELPASSSLGPIFTERAETIGKHKFYVGFSNQDFRFTSLNGQSLSSLTMLDTGGVPTTLQANGKTLTTFPSTVNVAMDVRLSQDVAFLTYGVTSRFDVSVGLPVVHAAVSSQTYNGLIFVGSGFGNQPINGIVNCWCANTFTPGVQPNGVTGSGLILSQIGYSGFSKTGLGDMLLRFKGNVLEGKKVALAVGGDLRLPTGDERNFLGTGAIAVKPFAALSLFAKPWHGIVFSPHLNVGWQFAGKSILGGGIISGTAVTEADGVTASGPPFASTKNYLPDVFSWAVGSETALGRRNTVVVDVLGNQIGWIHGIQNMTTGSVQNVPYPQKTDQVAPLVTATGLTSAGQVSFGQYSGAFGYKARLVGNLVATLNALVRFDNNGLTARVTPLVGLSYTF